jgi:hypothetical protein
VVGREFVITPGNFFAKVMANGRVKDPLALWHTIRQCLPRKDTRLYSA